MDEVSKSTLKAQMFEYLRRVEATKRPLIIKDHGNPVLVIHPYSATSSIEEVFHSKRKKLKLDENAAMESEADNWKDLM